MKAFLCRYLRSEAGAVTVDWVVLSAGIIALFAFAFGQMSDSTTSLADRLKQHMTETSL